MQRQTFFVHAEQLRSWQSKGTMAFCTFHHKPA